MIMIEKNLAHRRYVTHKFGIHKFAKNFAFVGTLCNSRNVNIQVLLAFLNLALIRNYFSFTAFLLHFMRDVNVPLKP